MCEQYPRSVVHVLSDTEDGFLGLTFSATLMNSTHKRWKVGEDNDTMTDVNYPSTAPQFITFLVVLVTCKRVCKLVLFVRRSANIGCIERTRVSHGGRRNWWHRWRGV